MSISRRLAIATVALGLAGTLTAVAQNGNNAGPAVTYTVDSTHSTALFRVHHLGAGQFWGRFNQIDGTFSYADGTASGMSFDLSIPIESIDTNNGQLDGHLKSPDFFNAKEFPAMTFKSTSARAVGDRRYEVKGDLTIHGTTRPITAAIEWTGTSDKGRGTRCGLEATFTVKRSEFGVMYGVSNGMLGDETKVIVGLEGIKR
jgi:polyisoprenoid-binding protein YceI